jgi:hypothetical protein
MNQRVWPLIFDIIDLTLNNAMTSAKKGKLRLQDATTQFRWRISDTVNRTDDVFHQLINAPGAAISEFAWPETKLLHRG